LLGGLDFGTGDEHEVECRHAPNQINRARAAQRAVHNHGSRSQDELQFAGHQRHHAHSGVHTYGLDIQAVASENTCLFSEPERQHSGGVGNVRSRDLGELRGTIYGNSAQSSDSEKNNKFFAQVHPQTSQGIID